MHKRGAFMAKRKSRKTIKELEAENERLKKRDAYHRAYKKARKDVLNELGADK